VLNHGCTFIEKPFVPNKLVAIVDVVLHSPDRSQGGHAFDTRGDTEKRNSVRSVFDVLLTEFLLQ
jgi:hypothetical protein